MNGMGWWALSQPLPVASTTLVESSKVIVSMTSLAKQLAMTYDRDGALHPQNSHNLLNQISQVATVEQDILCTTPRAIAPGAFESNPVFVIIGSCSTYF